MITSWFETELCLKETKDQHLNFWVQENTTNLKYSVFTKLLNFSYSFSTPVNFLVLSKITDVVPAISLTVNNTEIPYDFVLVQQKFMTP